jgi:hypothetical protein
VHIAGAGRSEHPSFATSPMARELVPLLPGSFVNGR